MFRLDITVKDRRTIATSDGRGMWDCKEINYISFDSHLDTVQAVTLAQIVTESLSQKADVRESDVRESLDITTEDNRIIAAPNGTGDWSVSFHDQLSGRHTVRTVEGSMLADIIGTMILGDAECQWADRAYLACETLDLPKELRPLP